MKVFVVVDVGCIECGESSDVIGVFTVWEDAERAADAAHDHQRNNWTGEHHFHVFEKVVDEDIVGEVIEGSIAPKKLEG